MTSIIAGSLGQKRKRSDSDEGVKNFAENKKKKRSYQEDALEHSRRVASSAHHMALNSLLWRAKLSTWLPQGWGPYLTAEDILTALSFIEKKAPMVIHVSAGALEHLAARELTYKNKAQMRPDSSDIKYREDLENRIYGGCYRAGRWRGWLQYFFTDQPSIPAHEYIKYGALNVMKSAFGVAPATIYGPCFLELSPELVRDRVTLHYGDTYGTLRTIGTPECFAHHLQHFPAKEIESIARVARGGAATCQPSQVAHFFL